MRGFLKLVAGMMLGGMAAPALAQTASANANGTTKIIQPIAIAKLTDLAFGTVVRPSTGTNSVVINQTTGARTQTGTGNGALITSTTSRATFTVTGEGASTFAISIPGTVVMSNGAQNITVTLVASAATGTISSTIGNTGTATIGVGGSFPTAATTASGNYTGTFATTVTYN